MESFISEIENPVVQKDIIELGQKIEAFKDGKIDEEKFRALRLARGVYGQRQPGVQMIRIKLPFGKVTTQQLNRIADVSDEYSIGRLHITTRQDIQIHYVSLDRTPELWAELEKDDVTLREACGNTVRNVTASSIAGIDPEEPFDVSPYAHLTFRYFLRKPFGQELGRKMKFAFASSDKDDAYTFMHDIGFVPKIKVVDGKEVRGFKVVVGGGLGAQPFIAQTAHEFLPAEEIIPFAEAVVRVFDRHGERNTRSKARIKYLIAKIGFDEFLKLVNEEVKAVQYDFEKDFLLTEQQAEYPDLQQEVSVAKLIEAAPEEDYKSWIKTNVFAQKQKGYLAAFIKVKIGDFFTPQARALTQIVEKYAANDIRFTIDQSILLKFIKPENLSDLYQELKAIGLAENGYNSVADITACPGTDTCNLGISDSTEVSRVIEAMIREEYPEYIYNNEIKIKISGCMNSCGQHGLAHIGFHGSSMKVGTAVVPALQVLLGGGGLGNGFGRIADKVIKVPSKRVLNVIRTLFNDYRENGQEGEYFNAYYDRQGKDYFYNLLKPLGDTTDVKPEEYIDWGQEGAFKVAIGVGECAGVVIDLVATLLYDADEKVEAAQYAFNEGLFADAIYHAYAAGVHTAKAILLGENVRCNTHLGIINDFTEKLPGKFEFENGKSFAEFILQLNKNEPTKEFAEAYFQAVARFVQHAKKYRESSNVA